MKLSVKSSHSVWLIHLTPKKTKTKRQIIKPPRKVHPSETHQKLVYSPKFTNLENVREKKPSSVSSSPLFESEVPSETQRNCKGELAQVVCKRLGRGVSKEELRQGDVWVMKIYRSPPSQCHPPPKIMVVKNPLIQP